ncbi:MAG: hypothetical protein A3I63_07725 [Betaproteobacteria bacterium RIFCSPLOWO2_02_FULL_66_14]|nr:MAG: hypothetical protein A3I63_07725 [Betaproteobacteria bacterium RIFCSPLOWO2_02_FULL_66_14]
MLTLEDCIGLCGLSEDEILAIAGHEHIPEIAAVELGNYLVTTPDGEVCIRGMIRDDITDATARGNRERALALKLVLRSYILNHPGCDERCRGEMRLPERRQF